MIPQKQLSLTEIYKDCKIYFETDKPKFLSLLEDTINLDELIPLSFINHFYASTGRPRKYSLKSMLWALIIQRIFSIPTDALLIHFLHYSKDLRDFCGFTKVPDVSKFTHFKQDFLQDLQSLFHHLVDLTEPICQNIDTLKASMTIFDTSGIEAYVTENNPKYATRIVKQLKAYKKAAGLDDSYDPYKAAYSSMPSHSSANKDIKQLYINGHFCYVYKFGLITNGLGIVRDISFYNKDFLDAHPEIVIEKKSDSPDEDKSLHDSKALIPVLMDFFKYHPLIKPNTFLGDAAFDTLAIYKGLFQDLHFDKAYIPLNSRSKLVNNKCAIYEGKEHLKTGLMRYKFVCPKMKWVKVSKGKYKRKTSCKNPCTTSEGGKMFYVYPEKDLRAYPGVLRGTDEWQQTYKIRSVVEHMIFASSYFLVFMFNNEFCNYLLVVLNINSPTYYKYIVLCTN